MNKVIYFKNDGQRRDYCTGRVYVDLIDYAFEKADFFMLVYVNYYGKGYSKEKKYFRRKLEPYQIKSRTNPSWPGTPETFCPNSTYKVIFYKTNTEAKKVLQEVSCLSDWTSPSLPEDLAFFKGNQCWFYSVGHEKIGAFLHATDEDLDFIESKGLASRERAFVPQDDYYNAYDEALITK